MSSHQKNRFLAATPVRLNIVFKWIILLIFFVLAFVVIFTMEPNIDWNNSFRPAARELLSLKSPYGVYGFLMPPWVLIILLPFAILPEKLGGALLSLMGLISYIVAARRIGASWRLIPFYIALPYTYICLQLGNLDWLIVLGYTLPPTLGLFLVLIKPQIGFFVALYWLYDAWRTGGLVQTVRTFAPVTAAFVVSFKVFGLWPLKSVNFGLVDAYWNVSLWPWSVPIGLAILWRSFSHNKPALSILASPLLSPYIGPYTWSVVPYGLKPREREIIVAWAGLWLFYFVL